MVTRTSKATFPDTKPKATAAAAAAFAKAHAEDLRVEDVEVVPVVEKPLIARIDDWLENKLGIRGVASWKRVLTGWIVALLGAAGLGCLIGYVAGILMVGAAMLTGGMFLPFVILALAVVLSYWAGGKVAHFLYKGVVFGAWDFDSSPVVYYTPRSI